MAAVLEQDGAQALGQSRFSGGQQRFDLAHDGRAIEVAQEDRLEQQAGGEGADDRRQADGMGKPGEEQPGGQHLGEQHRGAGIELCQPAAGMRRDQPADPDRAGEENHGLGDDAADLADADRAGLHQARHHGKNHQAQHVVDHCGAEHDARSRRIQLAEVAEDAAGDADRGGRQRRAEEQVGVV